MSDLGAYLSGQRPSGAGKALDSATKEKAGKERGETDRQAAANRSTPIDPDGDYGGNVVGCQSVPVKGV